ncbi:hypothetical protein [Rhizobium wuzhouense]|uniref:DUF4145 domain-containing protein n=1 Tax=Rhizobium wuzhouense TaxID=1986026 RepID=A0ABX5NXN8_9HYPH|nr:hypothetical protein [Rhizobium wuzhouense]PYB77646.1 hypothetical protein DMY87_04665 [Rhizobium wuzhouense]
MPKPLKRLDDAEYFQLIATADPFEAIIKSAIAIEVEMEELFRLAFIDPDALVKMKMTYDQKVMLMIALGLQPRFITPLRAMARLRNRFAHTLDAEFASHDADNFYSCFSKEDQEIIARTLEKGSSGAFQSFDARDRLSICVVTLRAAVIAAQKEVKQRL